jgi:hypothetical protein
MSLNQDEGPRSDATPTLVIGAYTWLVVSTIHPPFLPPYLADPGRPSLLSFVRLPVVLSASVQVFSRELLRHGGYPLRRILDGSYLQAQSRFGMSNITCFQAF